MKHIRKYESGNALWFILLAIALMGALTVTVTRTTDSTEQSGNIERWRIQASNIMRHSTGIAQAVSRMQMVGISENQVSFDNPFLSSTYDNANCTSNDCLMYSSTGGSQSYKVPDLDWLDPGEAAKPGFREWEFTGGNNVDGVGTTRPDLVMYIGYLRENLCEEINYILDINGIPSDGDGFNTAPFTGVFFSSSTINATSGKDAGCFLDSGDREHVYYQVLKKR